MISLGYSILMNELYCKIEMKGLNPYFGLYIECRKHPTLASDMMEEWLRCYCGRNGYEHDKWA